MSIPSQRFLTNDINSAPPKLSTQKPLQLLIIENTKSRVHPDNSAPPRRCRCPIPKMLQHGGIPTAAGLTFREAVVLLNNLDAILSLPMDERRRLITTCLDMKLSVNAATNHALPREDDGAGSGWRLTTTRPSVLSPLMWTQIVDLYHLCMLHASVSVELSMQILHHMSETGIPLPLPHEPPIAAKYAATETKKRRVGAPPSKSVYTRFGTAVWRLVYHPDLESALACRECRVVGMDWNWLEAFAKEVRSSDPNCAVELLNTSGEGIGSFDIVKKLDGTEEGCMKLRLEPAGTAGKQHPPDDQTWLLASVSLHHLAIAEAAAVATGCTPMPLPSPLRHKKIENTPAFKLADSMLKRAERLYKQMKAWEKSRNDEKKVGAPPRPVFLGGGSCCPTCGNPHSGFDPVTGRSPCDAFTLNAEKYDGLVREMDGLSIEAKRKKIAKMAEETAKKLPSDQAKSFLGSLEDPAFLSEEYVRYFDPDLYMHGARKM